MSSTSNGKALYENLDTTFVNLWSLLRNLSQRGFVGRVHVELTNYYADVFLTGSGTPLVHEVDQLAGTDTLEEASLHRLVLRARETPGTISVYEGRDEVISPSSAAAAASAPDETPIPEPAPAIGVLPIENLGENSAVFYEALEESMSPVSDVNAAIAEARPEPSQPNSPTESQGSMVISVGGDLIAAVERGIVALGEDFKPLFNAVRLELADDYGYLDPMSNTFSYSDGVVTLTHDVPESVYVSSLSEALRRTVDKVAVSDRARRVRERIALELLGVARKRMEALEHSKFGLQLDRIAGTKVI